MDRIVYVQDDRYEIPEELLKLSQEELLERIKEERDRIIQERKQKFNKTNKTIA